jgi:hypothetical protein
VKPLVATVLLLAAILAGCSSPPSLSSDQAAVDAGRAAVTQDQNALQVDEGANTGQGAIDCAAQTTQGVNGLQGECPILVTIAKEKARLKAATFRLQVAQDQLRRDER